MSTIRRFEDIEAWKQARILAQSLYRISRSAEISRDFALVTQLRKTAVSPMSNVAEGFGRRSDRDFANFLSIAHGSVAEAQSLLYVALDQEYIDIVAFEHSCREADLCSRLIQSFGRYLSQSRRSTSRTTLKTPKTPKTP